MRQVHLFKVMIALPHAAKHNLAAELNLNCLVLFAETRAVLEWLLSRHEADTLNHKQAELRGVSKYMWSGTWQLIVPTSSN